MTVVAMEVEEVAIGIAGIVEAEEVDLVDVAIDTMIVEEEEDPLTSEEEQVEVAVVHRCTMIGVAVAVAEEIVTMNGTMVIDRAVRSDIAAAASVRTVAPDRRCQGTVEASAADIAAVVVHFLLLRGAMMIEWAVVVTIAGVHLEIIIVAVAVAVQIFIGEVEVLETMAIVTVICIVTGIEAIVRKEGEHERTDGVQAIFTKDLS